jgi:hypothetical protein
LTHFSWFAFQDTVTSQGQGGPFGVTAAVVALTPSLPDPHAVITFETIRVSRKIHEMDIIE